MTHSPKMIDRCRSLLLDFRSHESSQDHLRPKVRVEEVHSVNQRFLEYLQMLKPKRPLLHTLSKLTAPGRAVGKPNLCNSVISQDFYSLIQIVHALNLMPRWMTTNSPGRTINLTHTISHNSSLELKLTHFPNSVCKSNRPWLGRINISPSLLQKALFCIEVFAK